MLANKIPACRQSMQMIGGDYGMSRPSTRIGDWQGLRHNGPTNPCLSPIRADDWQGLRHEPPTKTLLIANVSFFQNHAGLEEISKCFS